MGVSTGLRDAFSLPPDWKSSFLTGESFILRFSREKALENKPLTVKELEATEPLLQENPHRFVMFPIKYHDVHLPDL
jgi:hypothetical protein